MIVLKLPMELYVSYVTRTPQRRPYNRNRKEMFKSQGEELRGDPPSRTTAVCHLVPPGAGWVEGTK